MTKDATTEGKTVMTGGRRFSQGELPDERVAAGVVGCWVTKVHEMVPSMHFHVTYTHFLRGLGFASAKSVRGCCGAFM